MDNDVRNTEYCIGFSTAITRAMDAIERQRTTVGSHERIGIFRVFGRDAGYTALYTAYVTSMRCCIPEYKVNLQHLIELLINDKHNNPSNYSLVILSEGAEWEGYKVREYGEADAFGHRKKMNVAEDLSDEIKTATGEETVVSDLTYDLRSGSPDFVDSWWPPPSPAWPWTRRRGQARPDDGHQRRLLRHGADSRPEAGPAQSRHRHHVQHRALSAHVRPQTRAADFPDAGVERGTSVTQVLNGVYGVPTACGRNPDLQRWF